MGDDAFAAHTIPNIVFAIRGIFLEFSSQYSFTLVPFRFILIASFWSLTFSHIFVLVNPTNAPDTSRVRVRRNASDSQLTNLQKLQQLHASVCNITITDMKCRAGPTGPRGRPGRRGESGRKGDAGIPGKHGYHGNTGPRGPMGDKGERGEKGSMGIPGLHGNNGIRGPHGRRGEKGEMGEKGMKGETGRKGEQGPKGTSGSSGNPDSSISSPQVIASPPTMVINEGQTAVFNCLVRGFPKPVIGWSKEEEVGNSSSLTSNSKLMIHNVRRSDAGTYRCQAKNIFGTERKTVYLAVNSKYILTDTKTGNTGK